MKRRLSFLLTFCWLLSSPALGQPARRPLVLTHVTVVDATGGPARPDMTVVVEGGRIVAVGRSGGVRIPRGARVVNARGKFLIPGLWDAHTHHQASGPESLPLFVANGITATRDMGSDLKFILNLRRGVEAGAVPGPRIVAAGPMLDDAPEDWPFRLKVTDAAGQKSVEHLSEYGLLFECAGRPGVTLAQVVEAYSPERCAALFDLFERHGTRHTPTLAALHVFSKSPAEIEADLRARGVLRYAGPTLLRFWTESERLSPPPPEEVRRELGRMAVKSLEVVGEMNRRGVKLLAGCDALVPGFCLHDELELLVRAGLSPMEALQAATRNPAELTGRLDKLGTVEPNKLADLVLLDADPLADIRHTRRIRAVVLNGRYIPRRELQAMLSRPRRRR